MPTHPMKLQLGCGHRPLPKAEGWINHDIVKHAPHVDIAFDLQHFPWPIPAEWRFAEIWAVDVFEHLAIDAGIPFFDAAWELLEEDGVLFLRVPEFGTNYHLGDLTHVRGFVLGSFDLLDPDTHTGKNNFYSKHRWRIEKKCEPMKGVAPMSGRNLEFWLRKRPDPS